MAIEKVAMDMEKATRAGECRCGRVAKYTSTAECARCYKRRWREENPRLAERERARSKAWKEANAEARKAYDRQYLTEHLGRCGSCGGKMGQIQDGICLSCRSAAKRAKCELVVSWWAQGRTLVQIEDAMGWSRGGAGPRMVRMRKAGYDLPLRRKPRKADPMDC